MSSELVCDAGDRAKLGGHSFLVGVDREACAHYRHALDQFLPPEYSEVVYTGSNNDSKLF